MHEPGFAWGPGLHGLCFLLSLPPGKDMLRCGMGFIRSCRMPAQVGVQMQPLWVVVLSRTFAELVFLRENAPGLSHPWVLQRCFQPSDPTKVGLTGSLLRGHCCISPCCTTSSAMVMGTGTNAVLAPGTSYLRLLRSCCVH